MRRNVIIAITAAVGLLAVGGCGQKDAAAYIASATSAQCYAERNMFEQAIQAYEILEGSPPASEAAMVPNYLRIESVYLDIDARGNVIPAPNGGCT